MHATSHGVQSQRIAAEARSSNAFSLFNLLTAPELFDTVEDLLPEHRERLYPPTETLSMFLAQSLSSDRSCQSIVNDAAVRRLQGRLPQISTHTGGFCRARQRLPEAMVSTLARKTGQIVSSRISDEWRWKGRPVRLVDGTTLTMPDTADNQVAWPQPGSQKQGLGFPICRLVGMICLGTGALLNAAIGPTRGKGNDEQTLLRTLLDTLERGDLILADAFYPTYFLLCELQRRGVDGVFEQYGARRRMSAERRIKCLGKKDHHLELLRPKRPPWMDRETYERTPERLIVRECRVKGKQIVTTMLSKTQATRTELKLLYRERWQVEVDLRVIKDILGMSVLSCKTPAMVRKEIWVYLLAYNLIRMVMAKAAAATGRCPRTLSFKHALQLWLCYLRLQPEQACELMPELLKLVAANKVAQRPGRVEPRAVKRRPKPFPLLTTPRETARASIRECGHPKKAK
jgi:hypothetical protein